jgi:hypothetical protein
MVMGCPTILSSALVTSLVKIDLSFSPAGESSNEEVRVAWRRGLDSNRIVTLGVGGAEGAVREAGVAEEVGEPAGGREEVEADKDAVDDEGDVAGTGCAQ